MDAKIKEYISKIKVSAVNAGKVAGKTAGDVAKQAKLNVKIFDTNTEIDVIYKEIGKLVYALHCGEEVSNETVDALLTDIDSKKDLIADLKAELAGLKNAIVCPACSKEIAKDCAYCPVCGAKIEKEEECCCDCCCEEEAAEEACECDCCCEAEEAEEECCCCEEAPAEEACCCQCECTEEKTEE